jgi:hypothetical protein
LRISAATGGGVALTWGAGETQAGYHVVRYLGSTPTTLTEGSPLPPGATSFVDPSPVPGAVNCYAVDPLDSAGVALARSDILCFKQAASSTGAPPFVLQVAESLPFGGLSARLSWEGAGDVRIAVKTHTRPRRA